MLINIFFSAVSLTALQNTIMRIKSRLLCLSMLLISRYIVNLAAFFEIRPCLMKMKINAVLNALHMTVEHPSKIA